MSGQPHQLIYPTLDLFAYDQRNGAIDPERHPTLKPPLHGYIHQRALGDTCALHVDCANISRNGEATFKPASINCFETLQAHLLEQIAAKIGTIGKTWVLWGRLADENIAAVAIARRCYPQVALAADANWQRDLVGSGRILSATLFELWHQPPLSPADSGSTGQHLLICLFDFGQSLKAAEQLSEYLLPLLLHRHRLMWRIGRSQKLKHKLQQDHAAAGETIRLLQTHGQGTIADLDVLNEQWLKTLNLFNTYTQGLNEFRANFPAIAHHLNRYRHERQRLQALDPSSDLRVLQRFEHWVVKQHWRSLKQDSERLQLGIPHLENAAKMAEGAIAIEQLKSQHQLARTVVAASASVSTTAAAAISISPPVAPATTSLWQSFGRSTSSFLLSLVAGSAVGLLLWRCLPRLTRRKRADF